MNRVSCLAARTGRLCWRAGQALAFTLLMAWGAGPAFALDYPTKPIRVIVPFAPGGATDVIARILANKLTEKLGQQFIVDNRPGAGGVTGGNVVAKATPDGYTVLFWHAGFLISSYIYAKSPYNIVTDFEPIGLAGVSPMIMSVNPKLPIKTAAELIALSKSKPDELNHGSSGVGSSDHLAFELFKILTGAKITHIPYKGGGPAVTAAVAGEVQLALFSAPSQMPQIQSGLLRPLFIAGDKRLPQLPDTPTALEAGVKDYSIPLWFGMWAPAGTPKEIVEKLSTALAEVMKDKDARAALDKLGIDPDSQTAAEFGTYIKAESARWSTVIREAKIPLQ